MSLPIKIRTARIVRTLAEHSPVVRGMVLSYLQHPRIDRGVQFTQYTGGRYALVTSGPDPSSRKVGIYLRGGCDLPAMFAVTPLLRGVSEGTYCIFRDRLEMSGSHSEILLQARKHLPADGVAEATHRLQLQRGYFAPRMFDPTFSIPALKQFGEFPKSVVVLSIGPDFSRILYRHRRDGFLLDPGGLWLTHSLDKVLTDLDTMKWFEENFESVGRSSVEQFHRSFGHVVRLVKEELGAHVIAFNTLAVDPSNPTHNYQLSQKSDTHRRRQFTLALTELSADLDFHVVDVDRILKLGGVSEQVDFAHFSARQFAPIAEEAYRILRELRVA